MRLNRGSCCAHCLLVGQSKEGKAKRCAAALSLLLGHKSRVSVSVQKEAAGSSPISPLYTTADEILVESWLHEGAFTRNKDTAH